MQNSLLIDTFDIIKMGREEANHFDTEQFIEGLVFYDKVIFSVNHMTIGTVVKQLVNMIGVEIYSKLLDKKVIDFVIDDIGYGLGDKGSSDNMQIGRFEMRPLKEEERDIEKNIRERVNSRNITRPTLQYLKKEGQQISLQHIKGPAYQGNIAATLQNVDLVKNINQGYFPFSQLLYPGDIFQDYKINFEDGLLKVDTYLEEEYRRYLFVSLANVGFGALRAETFKFVANNSKCNNLSGSLATSEVLSNQFIEFNKTHSKVMDIFEMENIPNLHSLNLPFEKILKIRNETKHIRNLLSNFHEFDKEKFKAEYHNYFEKKHIYLDGKISKVLRFIIPTAIGIVNTPAGIAVAASENILSSILEQKKSAKLRTIFKRNDLI
ncbi:hypothetical protein CN975_25790 [Bacillus cereus]|uniref:hypothetical protein n=1 Tax=Bacillus cereus TaxID=1396 RepID=UPI000BF4908F|nr:hypothetical protein [Bacillus cereus]PFF12188.1 hypothetical protein CN343_21075 [Bacillus cereus]PGN40843.1 hypothetical protein CN960_06355 [Bacillus cereus]PGN86865.1 hypothetical protein CN975_25790 [Bacillus cereus]